MFILDEFDMFAKPFKQTVLYNLLDALQASSPSRQAYSLSILCSGEMQSMVPMAHTAAACTAGSNISRPALIDCTCGWSQYWSLPSPM